jgi:protoporphyrinogen oxidase
MRNTYGDAMAEEIAIPLLEAWSGEPADRLASAVVEKLPSGMLKTITLKIAARTLRRAIAIGYSREAPESMSVWHVYPENGLGSMLEAIAAPVRDEIRLKSPAEAIYVESERAVGVRSGGVDQEVSAVVSTAPCNVLPKLVRGTNKLEHLLRFRYRPMVFINLRFKGRNLLRDTVVWTPERHFPFFRLTEAPISMPWLAPAGKTIITADIGCQIGDEVWKSSDAALLEQCLSRLDPLIPEVRDRFLGGQVLRTPIAYPVFHLDYEAQRQDFKKSTGIAGLFSIGRNGEFDHILMEDVYWRTLKQSRQLARFVQKETANKALDAKLSA